MKNLFESLSALAPGFVIGFVLFACMELDVLSIICLIAALVSIVLLVIDCLRDA